VCVFILRTPFRGEEEEGGGDGGWSALCRAFRTEEEEEETGEWSRFRARAFRGKKRKVEVTEEKEEVEGGKKR